jgi:predicted  nucleic acid-binding Zn-ribbon protein
VAGVPWSNFFVLQELDSQIEALRDELRLSQTLADGHNRHLDERSAAARRDAASIEARLAAREADRAETARSLPEPSLRLYERLRARHELRPWVVGLTAAHCPACNLVLPSAIVGQARRTREPTACPNCHRLLVWRDPPRSTSADRPGAAGGKAT